MADNLVLLALLPGRLAIRVLDDFHMIAVSSERMTRPLEGVQPRHVERALDDLHRLSELAGRIEYVERGLMASEKRVLEQSARLERQLNAVIEIGNRVEHALPGLDQVLRGILAVSERLEDVVKLTDPIEALSASARTLATAVDTIQETTERLGRLTQRLPGAGRVRGGG